MEITRTCRLKDGEKKAADGTVHTVHCRRLDQWVSPKYCGLCVIMYWDVIDAQVKIDDEDKKKMMLAAKKLYEKLSD